MNAQSILCQGGQEMIPLKDENPTYITPYVNYSLIVMNILVYIYQVFITPDPEAFVWQYALVPSDLLQNFNLGTVHSVHQHVHAWRLSPSGR
jgi:membrane associated rhomboid family serine protease